MRYADSYCSYEERYKPEHVYIFTGQCVVTRKMYSVSVPAQELYQYRQGAYIQKALKSLSANDREFLMTGISPEGWKIAFLEEEEEL